MTKKNYGIELLRILSMTMIVILHILRWGGVLDHVAPNSLSQHLAYILQIASFCCVNCFALTSGYVMCQSRSRLSRLLRLWLQVLFYSFGFLAVFAVFFPQSLHMGALLETFLPISVRQYWYISAYVGMYVLIPVLNAAISHLEKKTFAGLLLGSFVLFSLVATFPVKDVFGLRAGESMLWLSLMYLLGGYLRKYAVVEKTKAATGLWLYLGAVALTYGGKWLIGLVGTLVLGRQVYGDMLMQTVSPTMVAAGLGLFLFCAKLPIKEKWGKVIGFFASGALGVYLIHVNVFVWENWMSDGFAPLANWHPLLMALGVVGAGVAITLVCSLVDVGREGLFRLVRIPLLCQKTEDLVSKIMDKLTREKEKV